MDTWTNVAVRFLDRIVVGAVRWFCRWFGRRRRLLAAVDALDAPERDRLMPFVQSGINTMRLRRYDPVIEGLLKKGVLVVVGAVSLSDMSAAMMIAPEIRECVEKRLRKTSNE